MWREVGTPQAVAAWLDLSFPPSREAPALLRCPGPECPVMGILLEVPAARQQLHPRHCPFPARRPPDGARGGGQRTHGGPEPSSPFITEEQHVPAWAGGGGGGLFCFCLATRVSQKSSSGEARGPDRCPAASDPAPPPPASRARGNRIKSMSFCWEIAPRPVLAAGPQRPAQPPWPPRAGPRLPGPYPGLGLLSVSSLGPWQLLSSASQQQ